MTMNSLADLYNQALVPMDEELEKQAAQLNKQAEEEDACGRIMARGFADELNKLAGGGTITRRPVKAPSIPKQDKTVTIGGGKTIDMPSGNQGPTKMKPDVVNPPPKPPPPTIK